VLQLTVNI